MEQKNGSALLNRSLGWTSVVYALTAFHHYYGSVVYGTPWRAHVVFIGGITLLICFLFIWLYRRNHSKWLLYSYLVIAVIVFGFGIGLFEGVYNHVVKNSLYFLGMNMNSWRKLFPAPAYEVPQNVVFESTGMLQFIVGAVQLYSLYKVFKSSKK